MAVKNRTVTIKLEPDITGNYRLCLADEHNKPLLFVDMCDIDMIDELAYKLRHTMPIHITSELHVIESNMVDFL